MPFGPLFSLPYPNEWSNPYWADFVTHAEFMDEWLQALRENDDFIIVGKGGSWALAAGSLSWDTAIVIVSATDGGDITIPAGALAVPADGVVYTTLTSRPLSGAQAGVLSYAATLPQDSLYYVLGIVYGGTWYPRAELSLTGMFSYGVYVDAVNGSDVTGDGTIQYPYQTLQVAYASVTTTNLAEFITPVQFILRPGTYSGMGANLPNRQYINVTGSRYNLIAQQYVEIDGTIPVTLANYPRYVLFSTDTPLQSFFGTGGSYFHVRRVNTAVGGAPSLGFLMFRDLSITTGKVLINPSGSANLNENTGNWRVYFDSCYQQPLSVFYLFGSFETPSNDLNRLDLYANGSLLGVGPGATRLHLRGVMGLGDILDSDLKLNVSYLLDYNDVAYTGSIGGADARIGIRVSSVDASSNKNFGWDGVTPVAPYPIKGDSSVLHQLIDEGFAFTNMAVGTEVRSWATHSDNMEYTVDWPSDSTLIVPRGDDDVQSGINLIATYDRAKLLTPGGNVLSHRNRAVVLVPPGTYEISSGISANTDFVDLIGLGYSANGFPGEVTAPGVFVEPSAYIVCTDPANSAIEQTATNIRIEGLSITSTLSVGAIDITVPNVSSEYKNLFLIQSGGNPSVYSSVGSTISGIWSCVRSADPLLVGDFDGYAEYCVGGNFSFGGSGSGTATCSGIVIHCIGGDYSFGGTSNPASNGTFSGVAEDCTSGDFSFGYSNDADGVFNANATRCSAGGSSYGVSSGVALGNGTCSGYLTDCTATGASFGYSACSGSSAICSATFTRCSSGSNSFGYSQEGDAVYSGFADLCNALDQCFGFSQAMGPPGTVLCSGTAIRCVVGDNCFGCGLGVDVSSVICSGIFTDCTAGTNSFGYNFSCDATFSGSAHNCVSDSYSFGVSRDNTGTYSGIFNGYAWDCTAGNYSFGSCPNVGGLARISGELYRCLSGTHSFGWCGGVEGHCLNLYSEDCTVGEYSITSGVGLTQNSTFVRCKMIQGVDSSISVGTNTKFLDCQFSANNIVLLIVDDTITPQIYACGLQSVLGAAPTIAGSSDVDARIAHCRYNTDIDSTPGTSVTNLIVDGYNVLDSLLEVF